MIKSFKLLCWIILLNISFIASADNGLLVFEIAIKNHRFVPDVIEAPAGRKIKLIVHNQDKTIEEFESHDLKREKIVPGGRKINVILAPLKPGKYHFFGEFHEETANGYLIIK